ncbi:uncharacterized protein LOC111388821 [Olea europaea var. sylvestris]|uniref:uncharacterized protein LOC111388821 n=1 Tax=Olea europaea var. sylvestris TaxID=158386 RepID=UPI000C1D4C82|nr:uncharacterized protein LOC111388821 [Olea europaea var. sylvestris]
MRGAACLAFDASTRKGNRGFVQTQERSKQRIGSLILPHRQNQAPPPQNVLPQQNAPHFALGAVSVVEQFRRYKPSTFDDNSEPLVVEEWIRGLEHIFRHIACMDAQKVLCAEFMLIGAAGHWWESVSRTRTEEQQRNLTWEQFKDEVMAKYFPQALRDFNESEFLQLRQGNMSLTDYERQFK